jgi:hypothetical protein
MIVLVPSIVMFEPKGFVEYSKVNIRPLPGEKKYIEKTNEVYLVYNRRNEHF